MIRARRNARRHPRVGFSGEVPAAAGIVHADPPESKDAGTEEEEDEDSIAESGGRKKRKGRKKSTRATKKHAGASVSDGRWSCKTCTMSNSATALACSVCATPKPLTEEGDWCCDKCTMSNPPSHAKCDTCGSAREIVIDDGDVEMVDMTAPASSSGSRSPARRAEARLEAHPVFLAGIEEAFGRIDIDPHLLARIAHLVRPQWTLLQSKFSDRDEKSFPLTVFQSMQKTLIREACAKAMHLARTMETLFRCMEFERLEQAVARCCVCRRTGQETTLLYSENCYKPGEWEGKLKHYICEADAAKHVMKLVDSKQCDKIVCPFPGCKEEVDSRFVRRCLSNQQFTAYSDACFTISVSDSSRYQRCPSCEELTEIVGLSSSFQLPKGGITITDDSGKVLSEEAFRHYSEFRLRCHGCNKNFCTSCRTIPYHLGKTCSEFREYQGSQHCRFCTEQLSAETVDSTMPNGLLVCKADACQALKKRACTHTLECNHPCYGVRDEVDHPPCLDPACAKADAKFNGEDLCAVCYVEELQVAPIVQLTSCGHAFHEHCVVAKISKGKPGTRHTFGFLDCPTCKARMDHPAPTIQKVLQPALKLYREISAKAEARLKIEGMLKDEKLVNKDSRYFGKPVQYAMDSFAYYNCFKCKKFYFGGRRDCEQNAAAEVRPDEEFVCFDCADLKATCKIPAHNEFQLWKCRFCCSPAVWFCFGTTHFCDPCHVRPNDVMQRKKAQTKQCPGPAYCPIKCAHGPNGPDADCEFSIGCGVCSEALTKSLQEKAKEEKVNSIIEEEAAAAASAPPVRAVSAGRRRR